MSSLQVATSTTAHTATPIKSIEAAIALRDSLRETLNKTTQLITALKQQKKHSRLMQSTLASLKQLQAVA